MKRIIVITLVIILLGIVGFVSYLKFALPNVGSAPDLKIEITQQRLDRGKYLANSVMACMDCHSQRDFTRYAGPIVGTPYSGGGEEFTEELGAPGNFYAPNLTPFHLKDWTDGEIYRAITSGVSKDGRALFPAMPYLLYGQLADEDIFSVIAYLRSLPATENTVPAPEPAFPFSLIINTIPKKQVAGVRPDKSDKLEYGKYMITAAGCIDCHTPFEKGMPILEKAYSGGAEFILPHGIVRSSNITPDVETGIGAWSEEAFLNRFKAYADSAYSSPEVGTGFNTVMPWTVYAGMEEEDLKAIYAYLHSLEPMRNAVVRYSPK